jgi:chromosome segregation ATPase
MTTLKSSLALCQSTIADLTAEVQQLSAKVRLQDSELTQRQMIIDQLEAQNQSSLETIRLMELKSGSNVLAQHLQAEKEQLAGKAQDLERQLFETREEVKTLKISNSELTAKAEKFDSIIAELDASKRRISELENLHKAMTTEKEGILNAKEEEQKALKGIIEKNLKKAKDRVQRLKAINSDLTVAHEEQKQQLLIEIETLTATIKEKDTLLASQDSRLTKLSDLQRERDFQLKTIVEQGRKLSERDTAVALSQRLAAEVVELREKFLQASLALEEHEGSSSGFSQAIAEKDTALRNLRIMFEKVTRLDERRQRQLEELQHERDELAAKLRSLTFETPQPVIEVPVEASSDDLESKNRKLQELLDRSQQLYTELLGKFRRTDPGEVKRTLTFEEFNVFDVVLRGKAKKRMSTSAEKEARLVKAAYLRKVVLQFFSQEMEDERGTMVPLILELVGCTPEQVAVVKRHLQRHEHLIAKTTGFFGLS